MHSYQGRDIFHTLLLYFLEQENIWQNNFMASFTKGHRETKKSRTHKSTENKPQDRFSWGHYSECREISEMNDGDLLIQRFKSSKVLRDEKKGLI